MANMIVHGGILTDQQMMQFRQLFTLPFHYYRNHTSPFESDFIRHLRTLAGLGFTASIVEGYLCPYQSYFNAFNAADCGAFQHDAGADDLWGSRLAEMVTLGLNSFRRIGFPPYYADFFAAIQAALQSIPLECGDQRKEAEQLLHLFPQPHPSMRG